MQFFQFDEVNAFPQPDKFLESEPLAHVTVSHIKWSHFTVGTHPVLVSGFLVHLRHDLRGQLEPVDNFVLPLCDKHSVLKKSENKKSHSVCCKRENTTDSK